MVLRLFVFSLLVMLALAPVAPPASASGYVEHITSAGFDKTVLQSQIPVVVQFDASWCPYCRKIQPLLNDLARDKAGQLAVYRVDIDAEPGLAQLFDVQSLPTLILIKKGQVAGELSGVPSKAKLYLWAMR